MVSHSFGQQWIVPWTRVSVLTVEALGDWLFCMFFWLPFVNAQIAKFEIDNALKIARAFCKRFRTKADMQVTVWRWELHRNKIEKWSYFWCDSRDQSRDSPFYGASEREREENVLVDLQVDKCKCLLQHGLRNREQYATALYSVE